MKKIEIIGLSFLILIGGFYFMDRLLAHNGLSFLPQKQSRVNYEPSDSQPSENMTVAAQNSNINVGLKISKDLNIVPISGKMMHLSDLLNGRQQLKILRIDDRQCDDCIMAALKAIEKVEPKWLTRKDIIVFGNFRTANSLKYYKKYLNGLEHFYLCEKIPIPADEVMMPYFLVIDNNTSITSAFFPIKESPEFNVVGVTKIVKQ